MLKKNMYIIILFLTLSPVMVTAQQPSVYQGTRSSFSSGPYSEISPVMVNNGVIFCSDRRTTGIRSRTTFEDKRLYNIFIIERRDTSDWRKPVEIKSERSFLFNNGPLCLAPDGRTVYFTSEVETGKVTKKKNFVNHSGIFIADLSGTILSSMRPFPYNNIQYEVGHPSVSSDGKYLFFASDMPGGQGGSDLYYCEWINGQWSTPVNLGARVNSSSSEIYPFMHPSGRLYFSSNRPGGKGRMDVYYTMLTLGSWDTPSLLPEPINSPSDDFGFVSVEKF